MEKNRTTRRNMLKALPIIAVAGVAFTAPPAGADEADAELIELGRLHDAAWQDARAKWDLARPAQEAAIDECVQVCGSLDGHVAELDAIMARTGADKLEDVADEANERELALAVQIRDAVPSTFAGLLVKLRLALATAGIRDNIPREDQDWDHEAFLILADDLDRLAKAAGQ